MAATLKPHTGNGLGGLLKLHRDGGSGEVSIASSFSERHEKQGDRDSGTAGAISYLSLGVPAISSSGTGRGGARNRADRESHALTARQVANLLAAANHAASIGLPFNRMISIHWQTAGIPLARMAKATGRFVDLLSKCIARHGSRITWLWVHENGGGKGGHCHLLAHVPARLVPTVTAAQKRWLRVITGQPYRARTVLSRPIGGILGLEAGNPDLHAANLGAALSYILKGANADAAVRFDLTRLEPGGRIIGKRCATSVNIGALAQIGKE